MKHDCNIVRDLMPLVADGVASAESETMVQAHMDECAECREYFRGLRADIPVKAPQPGVGDVLKRLTKSHRLRIARNVLIGIAIGLVLMWGISLGWDRLTTAPVQPAPLDAYAFQLSQMADGSVVVFDQTRLYCSGLDMLKKNEDGKVIMYLHSKVPVIYHVSEKSTGWHHFTTFTAADMAGFAEIRQGTPDDHITLWRAGDTLPKASAELEQYMTLWSEYLSLLNRADASWTSEDYLHLNKLSDQYQLAWFDVPEWRSPSSSDN